MSLNKEIPDPTEDFEVTGEPGSEIISETDQIRYSEEAIQAFENGGLQRLSPFMENPLISEED